MGGLGKRKSKLNLDVRNIFAMLETEHRWRCSFTNFMDGSIQKWDKLPLQSWSNTIDLILSINLLCMHMLIFD
jgi:hypothetical protein